MAVYAHAGAFGADNFVDRVTGLPVAAGTPVTVRLAGTSVPAVLWTDRNRSAAASNPTIISATGNLRFYTDDPGDFDVLVNGDTLRVTATPFPGDTVPGTSGPGIPGTLDADAVAAMLVATAPIVKTYSDASAGGTGQVTFSLTPAGGSVVYNGDGSLNGGDGTDPPLDTTFATHEYVNRGDDIVMTIRDMRYSANSVQVAVADDTPVALTLTPSTVVGRGPTGNIVAVPWTSLGGGGGGGSDTLEINWDAGDLAHLGTQIPFTRGSTSGTTVTWASQIINDVTNAASGSTIASPRLRLSPGSGLTGPQTRIAIPLLDSVAGDRDSADSEIRSLWFGKSITTAQYGHFHRLTTNPATSRPWAYTITASVFPIAEELLNFNTWTTTGASPPVLVQQSGNGSGYFIFVGTRRKITVLAGYRAGTAAVLQVPADHKVAVGDTIDVFLTGQESGSPDESRVVTAVTDTTISYTSSSSITSNDLGTGMIRNQHIDPYFVASRLIGTTLWAKAWRQDQGEPDWSDPRHGARWAVSGSTGPAAGISGAPAIYGGHIPADTDYVDYGSVRHTILG